MIIAIKDREKGIREIRFESIINSDRFFLEELERLTQVELS